MSKNILDRYDSEEKAREHLNEIRFLISTKTWFGRALVNWSMYANDLERELKELELNKSTP